MPPPKTAKRRKPTRTVASVVNAVHATATAVTAANAVASAPNVPHAKKVMHQPPTTAQKPPTKHPFSMRKTSVVNLKLATSKSLANVPPAKRVRHVKSAHRVKTVRLAVKLKKLRQHLLLWPKPHQPPAPCLKCKRLLCLCLSCTPLPKAAVWNG